MKLCEAFSKRLEQILKERGLNVYQFCKENGIGRSTIVNLKNGKTKSPNLATIYEVSDALGMTPLEFLSGAEFLSENIDID